MRWPEAISFLIATIKSVHVEAGGAVSKPAI